MNRFLALSDDAEDSVVAPPPPAVVEKKAEPAKEAPAPKSAAAKPGAAKPAGKEGEGGGLKAAPRAPRLVEGEVVGTEGRNPGRGRGDGAARGAGRGPSGGRGAGRGGRGEAESADPGAAPKRAPKDFDRHSNHARGHETVKKDGAGKGNWGKEVENPETVAKETKDGEADAEVSAEPAEGAAPAVEAAPPKEPEAPEMTLSQYEAVQAEKRKALLAMSGNSSVAAARTISAAGFSGAPLSKKAVEELEAQLALKPKAGAKAAAPKAASSDAQPSAPAVPKIATGFRVVSEESQRNDSPGDRGGRGGRGEGRGGGRGGGGRGGAPHGHANGRGPPRAPAGPAFAMDANLFPAIGGKA